MTDISKTIAPKSDQLNADDLLTGPRTITVTRVDGNDDPQQPISVYFEGDNNKPYKPGLSMRRCLVTVWGSEGNDYTGRSMTLYCDPEIAFGGIKVGGIRISHMSHIDKAASMMLTAKRGKKNEFRVQPLAKNDGEAILLEAQGEADKGTEALRAYWQGDGKKNQGVLKLDLDDLKKRAADADEASKTLAQRLADQEVTE